MVVGCWYTPVVALVGIAAVGTVPVAVGTAPVVGTTHRQLVQVMQQHRSLAVAAEFDRTTNIGSGCIGVSVSQVMQQQQQQRSRAVDT
jgi:hypothetical protein